MDVDWPTVVVSGVLSAVVGAIVSLLAVTVMTTRTRLAERRDEARLELRAAVTPMLVKVTAYRAGFNKGLRRVDEQAGVMHGDDYLLAAEVMRARNGLGPFRRWLVMRRGRRVFGRFIADLAAVDPSGASTGGPLAPLITSATRQDTRIGQMDPSTRTGTLHRGLQAAPESAATKTLQRDLRLLAAGF